MLLFGVSRRYLCFQKIIGNLTQLNKLDLSRNHIKGLPENIGNLTNLKYLNLSSNQLATLPATISKLKNLKHLDLKNNSLSPKFQDIVGPCQNESQCQQAAKNVLKAFSSQSDSDKKKKSSTGTSIFLISTRKSEKTKLFLISYYV